MNLRTLKVLRFFHLINKKKYNERRQIEIVKASPLFDAKWYLEQNPDVKAKKIGAAKHYVKWGWKEGRNPGKDFDTKAYLEQYPELIEKNWCPLFHYMLEHKEVLEKALAKIKEKEKSAAQTKQNDDYKLIAKSKYFNKRWYLKMYPDVKKAGVNPVKHYLQFGWKEGRNPSKKFSTNDYLDLNADVKRAKINPLLHYEKYGKKEGRKFQNQKCSSVFYKLAQFIRTFKNKKIKKIVLFSHELTYTGAPLSLLKAAECLKELGYQIIIVSIKDGPLAAEFRKIGKVFISNNLNKSCLIASFCDFAIINTITLYNEYNTLKNLIPTVWWIREPVRLLEDNNSMRISFMNADNIYTMSEFSRDEYLPYNSKVKIIKHGIKDYYHHVHIGNDKFIFTVIGTIGKRKGQDVFIDGIKLVNHKIKDKCEFHVLGLPYDKSFFSNLIKTSYDETNIKFLDPISDFDSMIRYYENISCVVVPSREEPTSRVALEAMMMGKPAIISDRVGARYVLKEGENGYTFPSENAQELASCIEKMADKIKKSAAQIEKSCREAYLKNNSLTVFKEALSNMIKETLLNYTKQKILVHLHLFYHDQLDWFLAQLKNITCPYDLFVTVVERNSVSLEKLLEFKPDTQIIKVKNYGYDVYPFWQVLQKINLSDYRYVLKIHTKNRREDTWKKDGGVTYTQYQWRNDLIDPLIGSKTCFRKTLKIFDKKPYVGMIGSKNLLRTKDSLAYISDTQKICEKFNILYQEAPFVCGTMFMVRSWILNKFKNYPFKDNDFSAIALTGQTDSLAHRMEVVFGILNAYYGYTLCGVQNFRTLCRLMKAKIYKYFEPKRKSYKTNEEYIQHSKYFDKKWYLKTYPDVKKSGIDPVEHYLKSGWKEGRNPGPKFNTNWYLNRYKDVKEAKVNPLVHYEKHGKYEGRNSFSNIKDYSFYERLQISEYKRELALWFKERTGKTLNLDNPQTFNEKIQWLKLYDSTPLKTRLADKYLVRDWVKEKIGEQYLIPLLGVYDSFDEIDFDKLPDRFVMKCNHGSGWNIIVKDKSKLDMKEAKEKLDRWLKTNFAYITGFELQYRNMQPKIIIEEYIENRNVHDLYDYKFWCFNGKVEYIQFLSERQNGLKMAFYDIQWKKQNFVYNYPLDIKNIIKPDNLDIMIKLAEKLSAGFSHVRIDFYRLDDGTIYFGEYTFTSMSGICKWNLNNINSKLGKLIKLPKLAYDIDRKIYCKPEECYKPNKINIKSILAKPVIPDDRNLKLTIVVPIYNALPDVKNCLASLLEANLLKQTKVILMDDCSNKETYNYLQKFTNKHSNFKLYRNNQNLGFIKNCNKGIDLAKGDIVVLLNSDTKVPLGFDKRVLQCFKSDKNIALASPLSIHSGFFKIPENERYKLPQIDKIVQKTSECKYPMITPEGFCYALRKEVTDKIGKLDEIFGMGYCEEDDLDMRALLHGYRTVLIDNLIVYHKSHASFTSEKRKEILEQNQKIFRRRWSNQLSKVREDMNVWKTVEELNKQINGLIKIYQE